jgi:tetratricopeptide (TPR) repeat protein
MAHNQQPFAIHNPALLPPDVLLAEFTARKPMLKTLLGIVRGNKPGHPPQHCLLIGVRGAGKTTTLWAIAHSLSRDADLARQWQPVVFDEESRRVGDLADFWLEAIRQWEHATQNSGSRAQRLLEEAPANIEEHAQRIFMELVVQSGKRALLLIDNFNDLLGSIRDPEPLHRLRAFLMKESRVMIIGAATRYFDEISSVDQPFNDFFRCFELRPLSLEEMRDCLLNLAQRRGDDEVKHTLERRQGTVRALHLLTGGNPRLIKTFYRLLQEGLRGDIRGDLEELLDEFTPYFKAIVDALPGQQQRILDAVALAWDPVEVAAIATATRLPSNQVSAQLRSLTKNGLVSEATGRPKRKTYLLADRFSNIHYLMRHGRAARNRFDWFVALIRLVFPDEKAGKIIARMARDAAGCGPEGQRDARDVIYSALTRAESPKSRLSLLHATLRESWDTPTFESLEKWFDTERAKQDLPEIEVVTFFKKMPSPLRKELGYQPASAGWWFTLARFLAQKNAQPLAEAACRKAIDLDPTVAQPWVLLGDLLTISGRPSEAEAACRKGIELYPAHAFPWIVLGRALASNAHPSEAEAAFRKSIEIDPANSWPWIHLGFLLVDSGRLAEAEVAYRKAIHLDPANALSWAALGFPLVKTGRLAEAEAAYRKAIDLDPADVWAWKFLGDVLDETGRPAEAEAAYRKATNLDPANAYGWTGLGDLLDETRRSAEAEAAYRKATGLDLADAYTWTCLGRFLAKTGRPAEAEAACRKATDLDPAYAHAWRCLGDLFEETKRPAEAEAAYRKATDLDPANAYAWACLVGVLDSKGGAEGEARACAVRAVILGPESEYSRIVFREHCGENAADWTAVLPIVAQWCATHPDATDAFDFAVDGFLQLARLAKPSEARALLDALPDATPFETLRDALRAHDNRDHLHRLAPERRAIAIELLDRLAQPPAKMPPAPLQSK